MRSPKPTDQRRNRGAFGHAAGPAIGVVELRTGANAEVVENRRHHVGGGERLGQWEAALPVSLADLLARLDPAASEETLEDVAPVVPPKTARVFSKSL